MKVNACFLGIVEYVDLSSQNIIVRPSWPKSFSPHQKWFHVFKKEPPASTNDNVLCIIENEEDARVFRITTIKPSRQK